MVSRIFIETAMARNSSALRGVFNTTALRMLTPLIKIEDDSDVAFVFP